MNDNDSDRIIDTFETVSNYEQTAQLDTSKLADST